MIRACFVLMVAVLFVGCLKAEEPGLCSGDKGLKKLPLPATFHIYKTKTHLGSVTVPAKGLPTFKAAKGAPKADLDLLSKKFEAAIKGDATFTYSDYDGDTHAKCGMSVKRSSPLYADALGRHFYSAYYTVKEQGPASNQ